MKRLARLLHCPVTCIPLILFRWLLLPVAGGLVLARSLTASVSIPPAALFALSYATLYLVLWTYRLPSLVALRHGRWALVSVDFVLSMSVVWMAGAWGYELTPFALGALVLPGALAGWRGAAFGIMAYIGLDVLRQGLALPPGGRLVADGAMFADYARPFVAAIIWPLSVTLHRRFPLRRQRIVFVSPPPQPLGRPPASTRPALDDSAFRPRLAAERPIPRNTERPPSATIERRALRLHTALRHAIAEAQQQGLKTTLRIEGREPTLPPGYVALLTKAAEIALHNVRKHAGTDEAIIRLAQRDNAMVLTVRDHGAGLLDGTADPPGFHQLKLLRYRLHEWGGTLEITEPDDNGVLFTLILPLPSDTLQI